MELRLCFVNCLLLNISEEQASRNTQVATHDDGVVLEKERTYQRGFE
jgi:hypothetical protein